MNAEDFNRAHKAGYDAVVDLIAKGFEPTFAQGMTKCPYPLGNDLRPYWMKGWNAARSEM